MDERVPQISVIGMELKPFVVLPITALVAGRRAVRSIEARRPSCPHASDRGPYNSPDVITDDPDGEWPWTSTLE